MTATCKQSLAHCLVKCVLRGVQSAGHKVTMWKYHVQCLAEAGYALGLPQSSPMCLHLESLVLGSLSTCQQGKPEPTLASVCELETSWHRNARHVYRMCCLEKGSFFFASPVSSLLCVRKWVA